MRNTIKLNLQWKNNTIEGVTDGQLEADIKALHEAFCKAVTERAATNIEKFARIEMEDYYTEIHEKPSHPIYYKRTKDMLNNSYKPFQEEDGDIYSGGIDIDSEFTTHEHGFNGNPPGCVTPAGFDEEEIYTSVWVKGFHGRRRKYHKGATRYTSWWSGAKIIEGKPDRLGHLEEKASSPGFINSLKNAGMSAIQKQNYSVLKFV